MELVRPIAKNTIYDIAKEVGASASTVSSALGNSWKKRRISESTMERIRSVAAEKGYTPNLQARGLRHAQSGLVALMLPHHDNKYFSSMSESFAIAARTRGQCPVIVATHRNPSEEMATVRELQSYAIDQLFVVAAHDPNAVSDLCHGANLPHVFIDHPSTRSLSVVTDNHFGAKGLTELILNSMSGPPGKGREGIYFLGGVADQFATGSRIEGFCEAMRDRGFIWREDQIIPSSYDPALTRNALIDLHRTLGGLPAGLLVNSITCFEGVLEFLGDLPEEQINSCAFGCYDYDPIAALLRFPLHMVRQRHGALINAAYDAIEAADPSDFTVVQPDLYPAAKKGI